jgi:hypothetical protein
MGASTNNRKIIVGAGAAGLLAGIFAARAGADVVVLESRPKPGAKIRVSGGGRCNLLPSKLELSDFHGSGSPHSLRNILYSWPLHDVRRFFEEDLQIPLKLESSGKLFPVSDRARDIVDALLDALARSGAALQSGMRVTSIERNGAGDYRIETENGESVPCREIVLATGGLSLPKSGSDGAGLKLAQALGHSITPTYPALVPLLSSRAEWAELSGISVPVRMRALDGDRLLEEREGDFLFTHRGFSGPIVLDMSRHVTQPGSRCILSVQWGGGAAGGWADRLREVGGGTALSALREELPERLARSLLRVASVDPAARAAELPRPERLRLIQCLEAFVLPVQGDGGYATAEVTGGGVPLAELRPATLESRVSPGLYLCGEILDATGRIGGFNFLWAWVTGRMVGRALGRPERG